MLRIFFIRVSIFNLAPCIHVLKFADDTNKYDALSRNLVNTDIYNPLLRYGFLANLFISCVSVATLIYDSLRL